MTGPAVEILRRMNVYDNIKNKVTGEKGFAILDDMGEVIARLGASEDEKGSGFTLTQELEIMRGDITRILADAAQKLERVKYRYGCSVTEIAQSDSKVTVSLSDAQEPEEFAAVIGADGMMSTVRRLVLNPDARKDCFKSIEQYTAFFSLEAKPEDLPDALLQHGPGRRSVLIRPIKADESNKRSSCYLVYTKESSELSDALSSRRPTDRQKEIFAEIFQGFPGSLGERALKGMWAANDFYVAQTAQVKLPVWSNGRVVLVGDSAYAPSPATGQGTALAIIGAYLISGELAKTGNPIAAFKEYDRKFRTYVAEVQNIPGGNALPKLANPESAWGVSVLRWAFWFISWSGLYKMINPKGGNAKFDLPHYSF